MYAYFSKLGIPQLIPAWLLAFTHAYKLAEFKTGVLLVSALKYMCYLF